MRTLKNQPESKLTEKLTASTKEFHIATKIPNTVSSNTSSTRGGRRASEDNSMRQQLPSSSVNRTEEWSKAANHLADIAAEQFAESTLLETKKHIFY
jgi:hypothetical protein